MDKQVFDVDGYWKVIVYYDVDYNFLDDVEFELKILGLSKTAIEEVRNALMEGKTKAITCSTADLHTSVIVFNEHDSKADYISSIVHEAEHVKQSILNTYHIEDKGEPPAYTIGYIVKNMYESFRRVI